MKIIDIPQHCEDHGEVDCEGCRFFNKDTDTCKYWFGGANLPLPYRFINDVKKFKRIVVEQKLEKL